jgi:hypothetical protein
VPHEPKFYVVAFFLLELVAAGIAIVWSQSKKAGWIMLIVGVVGLAGVFLFWPEDQQAKVNPVSINTQGGGTGGNKAGGGGGGKGAPGGNGGTYIQNQTIINNYGPPPERRSATSATSPQAGSLSNSDSKFHEAPVSMPTITLGCWHIWPDGDLLPRMDMGEHVPLLEIKQDASQSAVPIIKLFMKEGTLYADVDLYSPTIGSVFTLRGDEFTVEGGSDWDANYNDGAIEVTNEYGVPIFQLVRESRSALRINGLFEIADVVLTYTPQRFGRLVKSNGQFVKSGDFVPPINFLQQMFRHPYSRYPGQFTDNADEINKCPVATLGRASMITKTLVVGP